MKSSLLKRLHLKKGFEKFSFARERLLCTGSEVDLVDDKVGGTQITRVQILVFESDSPQPHLLGFELSSGNYSDIGTN